MGLDGCFDIGERDCADGSTVGVVESFCRGRKRADVRDWNIVSALRPALSFRRAWLILSYEFNLITLVSTYTLQENVDELIS
jgi:hypothetical protein